MKEPCYQRGGGDYLTTMEDALLNLKLLNGQVTSEVV
jgi:hypothetical protein